MMPDKQVTKAQKSTNICNPERVQESQASDDWAQESSTTGNRTVVATVEYLLQQLREGRVHHAVQRTYQARDKVL